MENFNPRIRSAGIVIKDHKLLLIYRRNKDREYLVFPGGGVEEGESIEKAALRELKEETTIDVKINKLLYHHVYDNETEGYFFLCDYISGEPKLSKDSIEYKKNSEGEQFYKPLWVDISDLDKLLVYPLEIRDWFLKDFQNNFSDGVKAFNLKISELRQNI